MWLSRQMKAPAPTADADLGMTTITGDSVGVVTRGEVRALPVYGPGGYVWMPESGALPSSERKPDLRTLCMGEWNLAYKEPGLSECQISGYHGEVHRCCRLPQRSQGSF